MPHVLFQNDTIIDNSTTTTASRTTLKASGGGAIATLTGVSPAAATATQNAAPGTKTIGAGSVSALVVALAMAVMGL
jgi:hypothetical protein